MFRALRDFEAGIETTGRTGPFAFTGDPGDHRPKTVGPPSSKSLEYERAQSDARLGALRGRVEERVLAGPAKAVGSDKVGPSPKALVREKSQASCPPLKHNVATLEYFTLTVFFSVFVERCSHVWLGCIARYTWLAVLTRTHVFPGHGMFFFWIPRKISCPWYVSLLSGRQRWKFC